MTISGRMIIFDSGSVDCGAAATAATGSASFSVSASGVAGRASCTSTRVAFKCTPGMNADTLSDSSRSWEWQTYWQTPRQQREVRQRARQARQRGSRQRGSEKPEPADKKSGCSVLFHSQPVSSDTPPFGNALSRARGARRFVPRVGREPNSFALLRACCVLRLGMLFTQSLVSAASKVPTNVSPDLHTPPVSSRSRLTRRHVVRGFEEGRERQGECGRGCCQCRRA